MNHRVFIESLIECGTSPEQIDAICDIHNVIYEGRIDDFKNMVKNAATASKNAVKSGVDYTRSALKNGDGTIRKYAGAAAVLAGLGGVLSDSGNADQIDTDGSKTTEISSDEMDISDFYTHNITTNDSNITHEITGHEYDELPERNFLEFNNQHSFDEWKYVVGNTEGSYDSMVDKFTDYIMKYKVNAPKVDNNVARQYAKWIIKYANKYGIPPSIGIALIRTESKFNKDDISPANCKGLGQLSGGAISDAIRHNIISDSSDVTIMNPETNIKVAMWYLSWCTKRPDTKGRLDLAIARYNGGGNRAEDLYSYKSKLKTYKALLDANANFRETTINDHNFFDNLNKVTGLDVPLYPLPNELKDHRNT